MVTGTALQLIPLMVFVSQTPALFAPVAAVKASITQSLSFTGNIKLTEKWTTSFSSGYDFEAHEITHTSFNLTRDLHCWQMSMGFSPFGIYKYYAFKINVNSSILRDLKYDQKKDRREYETW